MRKQEQENKLLSTANTTLKNARDKLVRDRDAAVTRAEKAEKSCKIALGMFKELADSTRGFMKEVSNQEVDPLSRVEVPMSSNFDLGTKMLEYSAASSTPQSSHVRTSSALDLSSNQASSSMDLTSSRNTLTKNQLSTQDKFKALVTRIKELEADRDSLAEFKTVHIATHRRWIADLEKAQKDIRELERLLKEDDPTKIRRQNFSLQQTVAELEADLVEHKKFVVAAAQFADEEFAHIWGDRRPQTPYFDPKSLSQFDVERLNEWMEGARQKRHPKSAVKRAEEEKAAEEKVAQQKRAEAQKGEREKRAQKRQW